MPVSPNKGCRLVWWSGSATKWTAHKGTRSTFPRKSSRDSTRGGRKPWGGGVRGRDKDRGRTVFEEEERSSAPRDSAFELAKEKRERLVRCLNFPRWMENIFKFPPSTELYYRSNEILKNSIRTSAATLETSKLVIDFSFTWVIVSSREVYCTRSYLTPFGGCLSNRLAGSRSWLTFQRSYIVRNYRGSVEYRGTIKSQRTIFPLISLSLYSNPQQQQQWF